MGRMEKEEQKVLVKHHAIRVAQGAGKWMGVEHGESHLLIFHRRSSSKLGLSSYLILDNLALFELIFENSDF